MLLKVEPNELSAEKAMQMLAMESISNENIFAQAFDALPSLKNDLMASASELTNSISSFVSGLISKLNPFSGNYSNKTYEDVRKLVIPLPEGFKGKMVPYLMDLENSVDYYFNVTEPLVRDFYLLVSAFVTNKDRKLSIKDETKKFKDYTLQREAIGKSIARKFTTANIGRAYLLDAYDSMEDITEAVRRMDAIENKITNSKLKALRKEIDKVVDVLDIAIKAAKSGSYDKASKEALMNLATGTYELARQVEFVSVTVYRIQVAKSSITETIKIINK